MPLQQLLAEKFLNRPDWDTHGGFIMNQAVATEPSTKSGGEFLTFRIGTAEYAIDVSYVQEIRSYERPSRIAGTPPFIVGAINLRGLVILVIDLRLKLDVLAEYNSFTGMLVLNIHGCVVGALVDSVSTVIEFSADQIKRTPEVDPLKSSASPITGIIEDGEREWLLLDIESLVTTDDVNLIADGLNALSA